MARLAVVDDQIAEDELHLLRLVPFAWLKEDRESRFENMPTEFGPVSIGVKLADRGRQLRVAYSSRFRTPPRRVVLHVPPLEGLEEITFNGESLAWNGKTDSLPVE